LVQKEKDYDFGTTATTPFEPATVELDPMDLVGSINENPTTFVSTVTTQHPTTTGFDEMMQNGLDNEQEFF
jgi:hypothetical protein